MISVFQKSNRTKPEERTSASHSNLKLGKDKNSSKPPIKHFGFSDNLWSVPVGFVGSQTRVKMALGGPLFSHQSHTSASKLTDITKSGIRLDSLLTKKQSVSAKNLFEATSFAFKKAKTDSNDGNGMEKNISTDINEKPLPRLNIKEFRTIESIANNLCNRNFLELLEKKELRKEQFFKGSLITSTEQTKSHNHGSLVFQEDTIPSQDAVERNKIVRAKIQRKIPTYIYRNMPTNGQRISTENRLPTDYQNQNLPVSPKNFQEQHRNFKKMSGLDHLTLEPEDSDPAQTGNIELGKCFKMIDRVGDLQKKNLVQIRLNAHTLLVKKMHRKFVSEQIQHKKTFEEAEVRRIAELQAAINRKKRKKTTLEATRKVERFISNQNDRLDGMIEEIKHEYKLEGNHDGGSLRSSNASKFTDSQHLAVQDEAQDVLIDMSSLGSQEKSEMDEQKA